MAIYSLHHSGVGRTTHRPGTAAAHLRYVTRESACTKMLCNLPRDIPPTRKRMLSWMRNCEESDRANARVVDKLMVAIPIELRRNERIALIDNFCREITGNQVAWIAAIHDSGDDLYNPHAHILIRDRDLANGKRVLKTTERGSTERFRLAWEQAANKALAQAGTHATIDRRSLAAQGQERIATIHLGAADPMERRGQRTLKGHVNGKVMNANDALDLARKIVREAEAALEQERKRAERVRESLIGEISSGHSARRKKREELLSEAYERSMVGSGLARFWGIRRTERGLEFYNEAGRFIDKGNRIIALTGTDPEIEAMLQVARAKGWTTLQISGNTEFCRRAAERARESGFIATTQHDHANMETPKPIALLTEVARLAKQRKGRQR
jgi:Large polyvalent protein-associated domain 7/MobA/MobL family